MTAAPLRVVRVEDEAGNVGFGEFPEDARLDLDGRRAGTPVWRLLGADIAPTVEVNATIATADAAGAGREAAGARAAGFRCLKVKVGHGDDLARLEAVRSAVGDDVAIRIDANGAWSVKQAVQTLRALAPIGIECCEEPCSGIDTIERVAGEVPVPVAIDETTALAGALERRLCAAACLKLARCGGIIGLRDAAQRARATGYELYLASMLDGPLGIAAALHAAAVVRPDRPCGLATLPLFAERSDPLPAHDGRMAAPSGPGLGDGLLEWYGLAH